MNLHHRATLFVFACVLCGCGERHAGASAEPAAPPSAAPPVAATPPVETMPPAGQAAPAQVPDADHPTNQAIARVLGEPARYQATILAFQQAVARGDVAAVAKQVAFPLRVGGGAGSARQVADVAAFVRDYPQIVTPALARAITAQRYDDLLVNQQGVALADGAVWIAGRCQDSGCTRQDVKVVTIQPAAAR